MDELLRIQVGGGHRSVGAAGAVAAAAAVVEQLGFRGQDVERVRAVVDALCRDVAECHFDDPREAHFTVILREDRGAVAVRIEDEGLPVGRRLADTGADSLRFESRGVGGNAVELTVRRNPHHQVHLQQEEDPGAAPVDADAPITARELIPEDAPGLARCIYRCYGYTYPNDFIYYHDQVISLIERGLLRSFVGVNPDGEVVGHSGIIRDRPEARVAESGMAAVDPRYRHHHLLESIIAHRVNACRGMGLVGTYADAVAVHPITQKASVAIGATEIGILLAEIPEFTTFRGITQEPGQRGSVVMYFHVLGEAPARQVFLPPRYHALLGSIYRRLGLRRTLDVAADTDTSSTFSPSSVHVDIKKRRGLARIEVESAGNDVVALVSQRLQELRLQRLDVVHLDLPLGDAAAMAAVDEFAELGFFYGALVPELRDGDVLRLQCLNNVDVDPDSLVLHTDEAKRILRAILADR
ncbi:MAG: hypothetical protein ACYS5W_16695 [Planctomycetota bacterium]|jgi:serine/threonine-protein kinase RsbW